MSGFAWIGVIAVFIGGYVAGVWTYPNIVRPALVRFSILKA